MKNGKFGWEVNEVDGHSIEKLISFRKFKVKPNLLKYNKRKRFFFVENNNNWHHAVLTKQCMNKQGRIKNSMIIDQRKLKCGQF